MKELKVKLEDGVQNLLNLVFNFCLFILFFFLEIIENRFISYAPLFFYSLMKNFDNPM